MLDLDWLLIKALVCGLVLWIGLIDLDWIGSGTWGVFTSPMGLVRYMRLRRARIERAHMCTRRTGFFLIKFDKAIMQGPTLHAL